FPRVMGTGLEVALWVLAFFVFLNLFALVHEFGHYFAGRSAGLRFRAFTVGPVHVTHNGDRKRVTLLDNPLLGGMVVMTPDDDRDLLRRFTMFIAGGPIASVILTTVLVFALYASGGTLLASRGQGTVLLALQAACALSIIFLYGTLVPYTTKTGYAT